MNIIATYEAGTTEREYYLDRAEAVACLTIPEVNPRGDYGTSGASGGSGAYKLTASGVESAPPASSSSGSLVHSCGQPYSTAGTSAVTTLASTILSLLFPINIPWFKLKPTDGVLAQLDKQTSQVSEILARLENSIKDRFLEHQGHATVLQALYEVIICGNVVLQKLPDNEGLRYIPLRSFVVKRFNGKVAYLCVKEEYPDAERPGQESCLYTLVDYRKGEVWQQKTGQDNASRVNVTPSHYMVVTTSVPSMANYATGFALRYYGLMHQINSLSHDMARAVQIAAKALMIVDESSGWNPKDIAKAQPGGILLGNKDSIGWLTAGEKLGEWTWVYQAIEIMKRDLAQSFALGLSQQPELNTDRQTAESVRRLAQELDAAAGAIAQVLQTSCQKPLAQAYLEDELMKMPGDEELLAQIKPLVTSGSSALSRLSELQQLVQWIQTFLANDPTFIQQIDTMALFRHGAEVIGLPVSDFVRQAPQPGQQPPAGGMAA